MSGGCPLLAQSGPAVPLSWCPLSGVKRTRLRHHTVSAYDPKRTFRSERLTSHFVVLMTHRLPCL
jgi:hypothetical protein